MSGIRRSNPRDLVPGFAKIITAARTARGWSQRELSRQSGLSAMCVCDFEGENRSPSLRVAVKLARALGLSVKLADLDGAKPVWVLEPEPPAPEKPKRKRTKKPVA